MMKVDLSELISAKFSPIVEAMLFIVVEAVQFLDVIPEGMESAEVSTLEFVKESYADRKRKVEDLQDKLLK